MKYTSKFFLESVSISKKVFSEVLKLNETPRYTWLMREYVDEHTISSLAAKIEGSINYMDMLPVGKAFTVECNGFVFPCKVWGKKIIVQSGVKLA